MFFFKISLIFLPRNLKMYWECIWKEHGAAELEGCLGNLLGLVLLSWRKAQGLERARWYWGRVSWWTKVRWARKQHRDMQYLNAADSRENPRNRSLAKCNGELLHSPLIARTHQNEWNAGKHYGLWKWKGFLANMITDTFSVDPLILLRLSQTPRQSIQAFPSQVHKVDCYPLVRLVRKCASEFKQAFQMYSAHNTVTIRSFSCKSAWLFVSMVQLHKWTPR